MYTIFALVTFFAFWIWCWEIKDRNTKIAIDQAMKKQKIAYLIQEQFKLVEQQSKILKDLLDEIDTL